MSKRNVAGAIPVLRKLRGTSSATSRAFGVNAQANQQSPLKRKTGGGRSTERGHFRRFLAISLEKSRKMAAFCVFSLYIVPSVPYHRGDREELKHFCTLLFYRREQCMQSSPLRSSNKLGGLNG
jgi:hypothetical protein